LSNIASRWGSEALRLLCMAGIRRRGVPPVDPIQSWMWGPEALWVLYTAGVGVQIAQHLDCATSSLSLSPVYLMEHGAANIGAKIIQRVIVNPPHR
jgi:hypothetical protein